jgi:hypothetical protein
MHIDIPAGEKWYKSKAITGQIEKAFLGISLLQCPVIIRVTHWGSKFKVEAAEYAIRGVLNVEQTGYIPEDWDEDSYLRPGVPHLAGGGNIIGHWTLKLEFYDAQHGNILWSDEFSWDGTIQDGLEKKIEYEYPWDFAPTIDIERPIYKFALNLTGVMTPLETLLHEYERMPELCVVQPEKEAIEAGQTMIIDITDFVDSRMSAPQPWQRILVCAEKGKILNGYEIDNCSVFEVGNEIVSVKYKAPQVCEEEWEEIQVWNSCDWTYGLQNTSPEKEIGWTRFPIYDRKPEKLTIRPEPIKVKVGDSVSIRLTDIVDAEGELLEPNEQVMVSVDKGRITNGMPLGGYKVFDVVQGRVTVNYQAPDDLSVNRDTIKIYNLCVKGNELVEVVPHKLIAQQPIIIEFPPLVARITRTLEESRVTHIDKTEWSDLRKVRKGNAYSTKRVAIIASFSENPEGIHIPHKFELGQGFQMMPDKLHYRMIDCRVVSETYTYNGEYYSADYDAQGLTKEGTTRTVRNGRASRINPPCEKNAIALKTDSSTGTTKVNYVSIPFFDIEFLVEEHVEYKGKKEGTDRQLVPNNSSSSRTFTSNFAVQPTVVKDKEACFKVTGGDGVRFMSGRCTETFPQPGDDLQRTTREVYEWQVSRR